MITTLSSKGQIVLPRQARTRLQLRPGTRLACEVKGGAIVLTPKTASTGRSKLVTDSKTGLRVTQSPAGTKVTSAEVRAAMLEFS